MFFFLLFAARRVNKKVSEVNYLLKYVLPPEQAGLTPVFICPIGFSCASASNFVIIIVDIVSLPQPKRDMETITLVAIAAGELPVWLWEFFSVCVRRTALGHIVRKHALCEA